MSAIRTKSLTDRTGGPFGVCGAIGRDFGFHPDILRVVLAAGLLWSPLAIVGGYGFAALLMFAGRRLFPEVETVGATAPYRIAVADPEPAVPDADMMPVLLAA